MGDCLPQRNAAVELSGGQEALVSDTRAPELDDLMRSLRSSFIATTFAIAACSDPSAPTAPAKITALPRQLSPAELSIAGSTGAFGINLLKALEPSFADTNIFISPLSATMALGMTLNGASGETFAQMRTALALPDQPLTSLNEGYLSLITLLRGLDPMVDFRIANSIWFANPFGPAIAPNFLSDTKTYFDARAQALDFTSPSALTTINDWVKRSTNGKIAKIVDQISSDMVMYLVNATYFKGAWRSAFDSRQTNSGTFTTHRGRTVDARYMKRSGGFRMAGGGSSATVIELPYGGDAWVMTIALPPQGTSIQSFVASLTAERWSALTQGLTDSRLDLFLPKFKLEWEDILNGELQALGMVNAFDDHLADFTRLSPTMGRSLVVTEVKQKTFVDVNEEGTEAAGVTSVGIGVTSAPSIISVDRPFVFAIRERLSGTIAFMGKIVHPTL